MSAPEIPQFDELLDLLRVRLGDADAIEPSRIHSLKELMADYAEVTGEQGYWHAFEELEAQGQLNPASHKEFGGMRAGGCRPTVGCTSGLPSRRRAQSAPKRPETA